MANKKGTLQICYSIPWMLTINPVFACVWYSRRWSWQFYFF